MELRQLEYFTAVANEGQFTRAAVRLLVAQPAVSAQIRRLERELGEPLFDRGRREATLTEAGKALLPHARAALAAAERGRDAIGALRGMVTGRLRIGVAGPVDRALGQTLGEFRRAHPAIEVLVTTQNNEPLLEALTAGQLDVGVVGTSGGIPEHLASRTISSEELILAVSHDHELAERKRFARDRLHELSFVTLARGTGHREAFDSAWDRTERTPQIAAEAGELSSLVELDAEGFGVAVIPRAAAEGGNVVMLDLTPRLLRRRALAWNDATASPAARAFISVAQVKLAGDGRLRGAPR